MWDQRGYFYRSRRVDGQPRRQYIGRGPLAEFVAEHDAEQAAERAEVDAQRRLRRQRDRAEGRQVDADYRALSVLVDAAAICSGYRRHNRGEFRRMADGKFDAKKFAQVYRELGERLGDGSTAARGAMPVLAEGTPEPEQAAAADQHDQHAAADAVKRAIDRINGGKAEPGDLATLRSFLAKPNPHVSLSIVGGSTLAGHIVESYTTDAAARLVLRAEVDRVRSDLARPDAPAWEAALCDHVAACWLQLALCMRDLASTTQGAHNTTDAEYRDRRLDAAQRRYLRALGLLAKVRHLGPMQVNIADQQLIVNRPAG